MAPQYYVSRINRLVGPRGTTFFEVELEPPGRASGQVATERIRVVVQGRPDAPPWWILAKARQVLSAAAAAEWVRDQLETTAKLLEPPAPR
jgi:hypothetical protein